jgi:sporulation protein YlmC with PRC-barrel domain
VKKSIIFVTATIMFSILLAAYSGSVLAGEGTPGTGNGLGTPGGALQPGATTEPTLEATQPGGTMPSPTAGATQELGTPTTTTTAPVTPTVGEGSSATNNQLDPGRISNLRQFVVNDKDGNKIGEVKDLVLNLNSQRVDYIIVSLGGVLGIGAKEIAIPCGLCVFPTQASASSGATANSNTQGNSLTLNGDKNALVNAPAWDAKVMPKLGQPVSNWDSNLKDYWKTYENTTKSSTSSPDTSIQGIEIKLQGVILASDALSVSIQNDAGDNVAAIKDIIIDPKSCKVLYVAVSFTSGGTEYLIPIPPAAFSLSSDGTALVLPNADTLLSSAPHFNIDQSHSP